MKAAAALAALAALVLAGCGESEYRYVKNSGAATYYKVPTSWRPLDETALRGVFAPGGETPQGAALLRSLQWVTGYDADPHPDVDHLVGAETARPVVYATVRRLLPAERGQASLDFLRDQLLPVTSLQKARVETFQKDPLTTLTSSRFELVTDEELRPKGGAHGVHLVYNVRLTETSTVQTFDQTAFLSEDGSTMHFLVVRCSARCFAERHSEIQAVTESFTVRGGGHA